MNSPITVVSHLPVVVIQISFGQQPNNANNVAFGQSERNTPPERNDEKKPKINNKEDIVDIKHEDIDNKENILDLTQEFDNNERSRYILHNDPNLNSSRYSPISDEQLTDVEDNVSFISEQHNILNQCFTDISDIVNYLKEGVM